ncbi:hypothetical protein KIL84_013527 [Mauremys mutica]|uniref:SCAN box domain-containing protein n=1 Tax=Mauremys mutica TaxID=74926 RepID=A0A9D3WVM9_9SAUR|nr:hypothetical protein KIL84_013527 [Mauremys mutica]
MVLEEVLVEVLKGLWVCTTLLCWCLIDWAIYRLKLKIETVEELMDILMLEQYLESLPGRVQTWVCQHQQNKLVKAMQLLDENLETQSHEKPIMMRPYLDRWKSHHNEE